MDFDESEFMGQVQGLRRQDPRRVPSTFDEAEEADHLHGLLKQDKVREQLKDYDQPHFEGAGGSGIVLSAIFKPFRTRRAIKLPRWRIYKAVSDEADLPDIDPELHALSKVSHASITRLYDSFPLPSGKGRCVITEYISDAKPLDDFAFTMCTTDVCRRHKSALNNALRQLAATIYDIVDALRYMHDEARLLHFDIKPDNILFAEAFRPYITDMGFARDIDRYKPNEPVEVGFTWKYAHPELTDPYHGGLVSHTPAKAKNSLLSRDLHPKFDIFSFGRSIQEMLRRLRDEYGEYIESNYTYNFLHIVACLCLDGKNAAGATQRGDFVSDEALGMPAQIFAIHKLTSFTDVQRCLQRLLGRRRLEDDLPEVDRWAAETVNCSDLGVTTLTDRVAAIVGHPALKRLRAENQLGLLREIFPTATHSRFEHSLGTYHAARQYLEALYYDPENPVFRALFDIEKSKALLIASLIHDVGATSYAHELEEVDEEEFSHTDLIDIIVRSTFYTDHQGRTLMQLVENEEPDCWSAKYEDVWNILRRRLDRPWDFVLHDVVDGQLDADKLDYFIRDSVECRVPYGKGIDHQRFLRSLTVSPAHEGRNAVLRIAIKQKGAASAEAFAFARYQLYQSLYWHHTFRAGKAMLFEAVHRTYAELRRDHDVRLLDRHPLRQAYMKYVFGIEGEEIMVSSTRPRRRTAETAEADIAVEILRRLRSEQNPPGEESWDRTMKFFWKLSNGPARCLIEDLMHRRYYKRITELSVGDLDEPTWDRLKERFRRKRSEVQEAVQESLMNALRTNIQSQISRRESLVSDRVLERVEAVAERNAVVVVDLPLRGWFAAGQTPIFVSDFKRRYFRTSVGLGAPAVKSLWSGQLPDMMRRIAYFRVFCEPEIHSIVIRVMSIDDVRTSVHSALDLPSL